jgi:hypothetical protein
MALNLRRRVQRVRRASFLLGAALALCLGLILPADAAARAGARRDAPLSEEAATIPAGESSSEAPASAAAPESEATTGREERRERRERRRAARRADRADVQAVTSCTIDLQAAPSIVTAITPLGLTGTLTCGEGTSAAEQTVSLYQKLARTPGFELVATTVTEADGAFAFAPASPQTDSSFYVSAAGAQSATAPVTIAPQVTISAPSAGTELFVGARRASDAQNRLGNAGAVTFTGSVSPLATGATVALQREDGAGRWVRIGGGPVDEEGKFSITHTFLRPGTARIRILAHSHGLAMRAVSTPATYEILGRRERKVTIAASADPISYAGTVTITGAVAGSSDVPVALLAQTGDGSFAPVAHATTNGGEYSFTESPLVSTRYRVLTAGASSATLAEGVSWSLVPQAAPASVQAEAPVSFTGSLAPFHEGQLVELECLDASAPGYHVIASATLTSSSAYSIAYSFPTSGTELLRITVPGNAELQSVSSEVFELNVTPAPDGTPAP